MSRERERATEREAIQESVERNLLPVIYGRQDVVLDRGEGVRVWDVDGEEYLDAVAGIAVVATGHSHPRVVEAIQDQAARLIQPSYFFDNEPMAELLDRLATVTPGDLRYSFLANSGAEAIEGAVKLAKKATGSTEFVSLRGSFHGRTHAALALTGQSKFSHTFHPYPPGFLKAPAPDYYRHGDRFEDEEAFGAWAAEQIRETIKYDSNDDVAAVLVEPVQGEGGVVVPPDNYLPHVKEICEAEDVLFIADEVQAGVGRTGAMFSIDHWDVEPDIMTMAKGIGSGVPLGAFIGGEAIGETMEAGDHFTTYGGNPLVCAAANATFDVIADEELVGNAASVGAATLDRLTEMQEDHELIGDVRGKGLLIGVEFVRDRETKEPADDEAAAVRSAALDENLLVTRAGVESNVIRLSPPLTITRQEMGEVLDRLERAIDRVEADLA